jgi:hypothetical protein
MVDAFQLYKTQIMTLWSGMPGVFLWFVFIALGFTVGFLVGRLGKR